MKSQDSTQSGSKHIKKIESFLSKFLTFSSSKEDLTKSTPDDQEAISSGKSQEQPNKPAEIHADSPAETDDSLLLANSASNASHEVRSDSIPPPYRKSATLRSKLSRKLPSLSFYKNSKNRVNNANSIMQLVAFAANDVNSKDGSDFDEPAIKGNMLTVNGWHEEEEIDHSNQDSFESLEKEPKSGTLQKLEDTDIVNSSNIENDLKALFSLETREEFVTGIFILIRT